MLVDGKFAKDLEKFITELNSVEQENLQNSIQSFCSQQEKALYAALRSITIKIPPGSIVVMTSQGPASNPQPILLNNVIT